MWSERSGLLWVITLSLICLLLFFTVQNGDLAFDRGEIAQGAGWRIITGNWVHTNVWHLLLNLAGLTLLYGLFRDYLGQSRLPLLMLLLGSAVGLGIWWWCPQTQWYMGLSGALHGLLVWGAIQDVHHQRRISGAMMLLGIMVKLAMDLYQAGDGPVAQLIGARVHIESHLIGAGAGLILGLLPVSLSRPQAPH
ncbi:rhombosortase [Aeromonas cavernicola]|uniref:Rhombosortase n=1 Tax=Aeromonas cavernicola TaxID=1006623 RepID=A0A2H9U3W6_9GAMM|nr:rhombosortase [Aeromonas cavernicola]PJG58669.1 rhombosortase [Aeromonas cavernicola]